MINWNYPSWKHRIAERNEEYLKKQICRKYKIILFVKTTTMFSVLYCYVYVVKHDYLHKEQIELKCCKILPISSKHTNLM